MKYAKSENILSHLIGMKAMLMEIGGINFLYTKAIFKYIINQSDDKEVNKVIEMFRETVPE